MIRDVAGFIDDIPYENKESDGDLLASMLFMSVAKFLEKDVVLSLSYLNTISMVMDMRNPREWECFELSYFFSMYISKIHPDSKNARFYLKKYNKKIYSYYHINKKSFFDFYKKMDLKKIRENVKGYLRRRWGKQLLMRGCEIAKDAKENGSVKDEWNGVVVAYLESIFLMYLVGNVEEKEIKKLEYRAKAIMLSSGGVENLAPYHDFIL